MQQGTNPLIGRAAAIAADKKSFDLCDDSEGLGVGKVLSDPEYLKHFGYGPAVEQPKREAEEGKANGVAAETAPKENGTTNGAGPEGTVSAAPGEQKSIGITVEKIEEAKDMLAVKNIDIPQAIPKEVANTA
jgi:hypothetical protein